MKLADFSRLKKFMMMTMSGSDNEVLFAIKKANDLLRVEGVDWDRVLERMVKIDVESADRYEEEPATEEERIARAFADVEASDPRGSFADFVASLKDQWDRRSLSDKQKAALFAAAEKCR